MTKKGELMSWHYGLVRTKIEDSEWLYLAEIYGEHCHSDNEFLGGISGKDKQEVIDMLKMILKDLEEYDTIIDEVKDN